MEFQQAVHRRARRPWAGAVRGALLGLSALLWLALAICYAVRPDAAAAVTLWPPWQWLAPGLLLAAPGGRQTGRTSAAVGLLWVAFLLLFAEESRSLSRFGSWPAPGWEEARQRGEALRVVSLNCAGGSAEAAAEVAPYRPDIVLLQEAPRPAEVEQLARRLFGPDGGAAAGLDAAILARGRITPVALPRPARLIAAQGRVELASGRIVEVISLRPVPPTVRIDLWSPACWREQTANRRARREQVTEIALLPPDRPLIAGGNFNAPADDRTTATSRRACGTRSAPPAGAGAIRC